MRPVILVQITGFQKDESSIKMKIYLRKKSPAKFLPTDAVQNVLFVMKKEALKRRQRNKKYSFSVKKQINSNISMSEYYTFIVNIK